MRSRYGWITCHGHKRATKRGRIYSHLLVAERALGRELPDGAEVHHVDGNKGNNVNANLVICQDRDYHQFLHVRTRIVRAGGNPNTHRICASCRTLKPLADFNRAKADKSYGRQGACRECHRSKYEARRRAARSEAPFNG